MYEALPQEDIKEAKRRFEEACCELEAVIEMLRARQQESDFRKESYKIAVKNRRRGADPERVMAAYLNITNHAEAVLKSMFRIAEAYDYLATKKNHITYPELETVALETAKLLQADFKNTDDGYAQIEAYSKLARKIEKKPSGRLLGGVMLAVAGVALIAVSIAAAVFTFGAATPISALSFMAGVSALSVGITVATGVAGLGLFAGGILMNRSGRAVLEAEQKRNALSANMDDFAEIMRNPRCA